MESLKSWLQRSSSWSESKDITVSRSLSFWFIVIGDKTRCLFWYEKFKKLGSFSFSVTFLGDLNFWFGSILFLLEKGISKSYWKSGVVISTSWKISRFIYFTTWSLSWFFRFLLNKDAVFNPVLGEFCWDLAICLNFCMSFRGEIFWFSSEILYLAWEALTKIFERSWSFGVLKLRIESIGIEASEGIKSNFWVAFLFLFSFI